MPDRTVQETLRARDSRGMDPVSYAALRTARQTADLMPLLDLLQPPEQGEQTQTQKMVELLEAMAAAIVRIEQRQVALASRLDARSGSSRPPRPSGVTGSTS